MFVQIDNKKAKFYGEIEETTKQKINTIKTSEKKTWNLNSV